MDPALPRERAWTLNRKKWSGFSQAFRLALDDPAPASLNPAGGNSA